MTSNTLAAAVLATGIWVVFAFAVIVGLMHGPRENIRVAPSSVTKMAAAP